ncbi:TlpA disulfide reductase family protein [Rheinheimera pacifica]|uniref:TlpA family protein disulfide reductase n=1 Tax=Rheinheimera pacifica TaxID=173990 RepID=UPI002ED8893C
MKRLIQSSMLLLALGLSATVQTKTAPDFTLKALDGNNLRLAEQRGDIMLINFWASWCGPCIQEMPALDKLAQKYQMLGVQVWGVNVENDSSAAKAYLSKVQVAFPILFDVDNSVSKDYRVEAMPTTVILDKDGKVRSVHRGYKPGYEKKYEDDIKGLLRE